jgi:hypothetical protein
MDTQTYKETDEESYLELQYFDWRCDMCYGIAASPRNLSTFKLSNWGPFTDVDGKQWQRCFTCKKAFHLHCLKVSMPPKKIWYCIRCRTQPKELE